MCAFYNYAWGFGENLSCAVGSYCGESPISYYYISEAYCLQSYSPTPTPSYKCGDYCFADGYGNYVCYPNDCGMSAAGIAWVTTVSVLFGVILPIIFCCLKAKGRAKPPAVDFTEYPTQASMASESEPNLEFNPDINNAGLYTQQMTQQPRYQN